MMPTVALPKREENTDYAEFFLELSRGSEGIVSYLDDQDRVGHLITDLSLAEGVLDNGETNLNPYHPYKELTNNYAPVASSMLKIASKRKVLSRSAEEVCNSYAEGFLNSFDRNGFVDDITAGIKKYWLG